MISMELPTSTKDNLSNVDLNAGLPLFDTTKKHFKVYDAVLSNAREFIYKYITNAKDNCFSNYLETSASYESSKEESEKKHMTTYTSIVSKSDEFYEDNGSIAKTMLPLVVLTRLEDDNSAKMKSIASKNGSSQENKKYHLRKYNHLINKDKCLVDSKVISFSNVLQKTFTENRKQINPCVQIHSPIRQHNSRLYSEMTFVAKVKDRYSRKNISFLKVHRNSKKIFMKKNQQNIDKSKTTNLIIKGAKKQSLGTDLINNNGKRNNDKNISSKKMCNYKPEHSYVEIHCKFPDTHSGKENYGKDILNEDVNSTNMITKTSDLGNISLADRMGLEVSCNEEKTDLEQLCTTLVKTNSCDQLESLCNLEHNDSIIALNQSSKIQSHKLSLSSSKAVKYQSAEKNSKKIKKLINNCDKYDGNLRKNCSSHLRISTTVSTHHSSDKSKCGFEHFKSWKSESLFAKSKKQGIIFSRNKGNGNIKRDTCSIEHSVANSNNIIAYRLSRQTNLQGKKTNIENLDEILTTEFTEEKLKNIIIVLKKENCKNDLLKQSDTISQFPNLLDNNLATTGIFHSKNKPEDILKEYKRQPMKSKKSRKKYQVPLKKYRNSLDKIIIKKCSTYPISDSDSNFHVVNVIDDQYIVKNDGDGNLKTIYNKINKSKPDLGPLFFRNIAKNVKQPIKNVKHKNHWKMRKSSWFLKKIAASKSNKKLSVQNMMFDNCAFVDCEDGMKSTLIQPTEKKEKNKKISADIDKLPRILPPKRRRIQVNTPITQRMQETPIERFMREFPRHNWLENKINRQLQESHQADTPSEESEFSSENNIISNVSDIIQRHSVEIPLLEVMSSLNCNRTSAIEDEHNDNRKKTVGTKTDGIDKLEITKKCETINCSDVAKSYTFNQCSITLEEIQPESVPEDEQGSQSLEECSSNLKSFRENERNSAATFKVKNNDNTSKGNDTRGIITVKMDHYDVQNEITDKNSSLQESILEAKSGGNTKHSDSNCEKGLSSILKYKDVANDDCKLPKMPEYIMKDNLEDENNGTSCDTKKCVHSHNNTNQPVVRVSPHIQQMQAAVSETTHSLDLIVQTKNALKVISYTNHDQLLFKQQTITIDADSKHTIKEKNNATPKSIVSAISSVPSETNREFDKPNQVQMINISNYPQIQTTPTWTSPHNLLTDMTEKTYINSYTEPIKSKEPEKHRTPLPNLIHDQIPNVSVLQHSAGVQTLDELRFIKDEERKKHPELRHSKTEKLITINTWNQYIPFVTDNMTDNKSKSIKSLKNSVIANDGAIPLISKATSSINCYPILPIGNMYTLSQSQVFTNVTASIQGPKVASSTNPSTLMMNVKNIKGFRCQPNNNDNIKSKKIPSILPPVAHQSPKMSDLQLHLKLEKKIGHINPPVFNSSPYIPQKKIISVSPLNRPVSHKQISPAHCQQPFETAGHLILPSTFIQPDYKLAKMNAHDSSEYTQNNSYQNTISSSILDQTISLESQNAHIYKQFAIPVNEISNNKAQLNNVNLQQNRTNNVNPYQTIPLDMIRKQPALNIKQTFSLQIPMESHLNVKYQQPFHSNPSDTFYSSASNIRWYSHPTTSVFKRQASLTGKHQTNAAENQSSNFCIIDLTIDSSETTNVEQSNGQKSIVNNLKRHHSVDSGHNESSFLHSSSAVTNLNTKSLKLVFDPQRETNVQQELNAAIARRSFLNYRRQTIPTDNRTSTKCQGKLSKSESQLSQPLHINNQSKFVKDLQSHLVSNSTKHTQPAHSSHMVTICEPQYTQPEDLSSRNSAIETSVKKNFTWQNIHGQFSYNKIINENSDVICNNAIQKSVMQTPHVQIIKQQSRKNSNTVQKFFTNDSDTVMHSYSKVAENRMKELMVNVPKSNFSNTCQEVNHIKKNVSGDPLPLNLTNTSRSKNLLERSSLFEHNSDVPKIPPQKIQKFNNPNKTSERQQNYFPIKLRDCTIPKQPSDRQMLSRQITGFSTPQFHIAPTIHSNEPHQETAQSSASMNTPLSDLDQVGPYMYIPSPTLKKVIYSQQPVTHYTNSTTGVMSQPLSQLHTQFSAKNSPIKKLGLSSDYGHGIFQQQQRHNMASFGLSSHDIDTASLQEASLSLHS